MKTLKENEISLTKYNLTLTRMQMAVTGIKTEYFNGRHCKRRNKIHQLSRTV